MTMSQATILVVDDEPVLRLTFSIVLKQHGATVLTAENGLEALEVLEANTVDVILSDKQMPEMDGLTLLRTMYQQEIRVPAIFFVNGVLSESPSEMERLGVVETVTKPLHPTDLLKVLERVLAPIPARA